MAGPNTARPEWRKLDSLGLVRREEQAAVGHNGLSSAGLDPGPDRIGTVVGES